MSDTVQWSPPPSSVTVKLPDPISSGGQNWDSLTLRAPTAGECMAATAIIGSSDRDVMTRLISSMTGMPIDGVKQMPDWLVAKIGNYFAAFTGGPEIYPTGA